MFSESPHNEISFKSRFQNRESVTRTVCGSEFQTDGDENRKSRLEKSVIVIGWISSGMKTEERRDRLPTRSMIQSHW